METDTIKKIKLKHRSTVGIVAAVIILLMFLILFIMNYYKNLDDQLFEERKLHLIELTDKVSEVIDSVVDSAWKQVDACRHIVMNGGSSLQTTQGLINLLAGTRDFIDTETSIVLAMDRDGHYFASDGRKGYWTENRLIMSGAPERQQAFAEIPHIANKTYFVFMERLANPIKIQNTGEEITHIALAFDIDMLRNEMSIRGFGEECYSYIINSDGRRLYEYTYTHNFITGYNILAAIETYPIVKGGTHEDLRTLLKEGESTALEFEFFDETTGDTVNWFVANSDIESADWRILLFVPTSVLGANTSAIMNQTVRFFLVLAMVLVLMFCMMMFIIMQRQSDKRLIHHQEKANVILAAAAKEAESASKAKSEFLAYMSHDIRTPINGIMGMTNIAIKHIDERERVLDCLGKIQGSSEHLMTLINDVLNMSRIESGKTEVGHTPFNLRICLSDCAAIIEGQLTTRDVTLIREFDELEHPLVIGDELHLRQIFINILGNAVKFTPDGGTIMFRGREIGYENGRAIFHFELEDTGMGMKPEFLPHLFEPFMQEDAGARTTYKGTGLGMAITKQLMELLGGTIQVESTLNVGTKFVLELPMDIDFEVKEEKIEDTGVIDLSGMRVLLVEDNELNLEIAQVILEEADVVVTAAENGRLAVETFEKNPEGTFDAILMDIMMPVMDGIAATKAIRSLSRPDAVTVPILAMTANAYEEDVRRTKEAGMNAHLSKPINPDILLRTLEHFYTRKRRLVKPDLTGKRFLLAEDNDLNAEIAQEILQEAGLVVVHAENGQEALDTFLSSPPGSFDLILMDMNMPVMDGITAAKAIRASDRSDAKTIPIFAMTANAYEEDVRKTKEAGMNGHLTKPLEMETLPETLAEYILNREKEGNEHEM